MHTPYEYYRQVWHMHFRQVPIPLCQPLPLSHH